MEMNHPPTAQYPSSGYLTPASSSNEGRRGSVASMQSSSSCAHSFSSNSSAYYPAQMPPTPHSTRDSLPDEWLLVHPQNGLQFDHPSSHDMDEYNAEPWSTPGAAFPKARMENESRHGSWVLIPQQPPPGISNALRIPDGESDAMTRDFSSSFDTQMTPQAPRSLQPAAEIYSSSAASEMWNTHNTTTSSYTLPGVASEVYAPVTTLPPGFNPNFEWPGAPTQNFELPMFPEASPDLVQPEDTMMDTDDKYNEMRSDSFDDSFGSYDGGYSSSTSPSSRYGHGDEPHIKQEIDSDLHRRDSKHFLTPVRKNSRRDAKVRAGGIHKRKMRTNNMMESFDAHHNGCQVEVKYQAGIQVDPKSGRYCSASGETKKQRCRFDGCVKTFARPEHLKRHENTHSKERPFPCVVPQCGRRFSRNDNRKAHYETHLKEALLGKKARNAPVTFEDLCRYLHSSEPEEEARKMIEKLQNPKSKLKSRD